MKANELMIGDWVRNDLNQVEKVFELRETQAMLSYNDLYNYEDLQPIPLTSEILKNNFEKKTMYGIFDDYFDLDIREFNDGMYIVNYHCCEMPMPDTQIVGICYVHELQHALHFLGIDKEFQL